MKEIERKFLVTDEYKVFIEKSIEIKQAYLSLNPNCTVRIRTMDTEAFLTIKGKSDATGLERFEWEKKIEYTEAEPLFLLAQSNIIHKIRHHIHYEGNLFEVDEFKGVHEGLVVAEVELQSTNQTIKLPSWITKEVTGDIQYYNATLSTLKPIK